MQQELAFIVLCALLCIATAAPLDVAPDDEDDAAESASSSGENGLIEVEIMARNDQESSTSMSKSPILSSRNSTLENENLFEGDLNITQELIDLNYGNHSVSSI